MAGESGRIVVTLVPYLLPLPLPIWNVLAETRTEPCASRVGMEDEGG